MAKGKPRVLCMLDLTLSPDGLSPLQEVAAVDIFPIDRKILLERIGEYDAYYGHTDIQVDQEVIGRANMLKVVASPSTGTDHLDVKLLKEKGIALLSLTKEYALLDSFTATAECAWALLLAVVRHIPEAVESVRTDGKWLRERFYGWQLSQKTLGILGVGRLGRMVVEYGKAFRMKVLGCDLKEFSIAGVERVDFDALLRQSDVISIHIHLNDQTRGLISREAFARMKRGVVIVNTSRGAIIDEPAFLEALESGKVAAAGLDIIEGEWLKDITTHPLVQYAQKHHNLIITPHIGGATVESIAGARIFMAERLAEYLRKHFDVQGNICS